MSREKVDLWVGIFVLVGALGLVFLALKAGNLLSVLSVGKTYAVTANFDNIGGLAPARRSRALAWSSGGSPASRSMTRCSRAW